MSSKTAPQTDRPLTGEVLEKGFENGIGEYNCFLNVVLQGTSNNFRVSQLV